MPRHGIIPYIIAIFLLNPLPLLIFILPIAIPVVYLFAVLPTKRHFTNLELQYGMHHRSESSETTASEAVKAESDAVPAPDEATGMADKTFKERDDRSNESGGSVTPTNVAEDDPNEGLFAMPIKRNVGNTAQERAWRVVVEAESEW